MRLKDIDIAFFDLDGVLSVPRYETRLGVKCALPDEDWFESANWGSDLYKHCEPVPQVLKLLEQLKKRNTRLFVLTHETNSGAYFNKVDFVLKYYKDYFPSYREVLFTSKLDKKVDLMCVYVVVMEFQESIVFWLKILIILVYKLVIMIFRCYIYLSYC